MQKSKPMDNHISVSPITKKTYRLPEKVNDSARINAFVEQFHGRKIVVVQGLGFVGAVMALVCANSNNDEYAVIGVDLCSPETYWKICEINSGPFPIISSDPKVNEYYLIAKEKNNIYATCDPYAYSIADIIIVDINLDVDKINGATNNLIDFSVNLSGFNKAIKTIGENYKEDSLVIIETTVPPGTCNQVVYPILSQCLIERGLDGSNIMIGHSYERVMPGPDYINSIKNFYRVYSGIDNRSASATEKFLKSIISTDEYPLIRLGNTSATEIAKVLENSYRAMNIAFMVEWSRFAEEAGVNLFEIVDAIRKRPTHSNLMYPGIGVGGYCLTKDALLASWSRVNLFKGDDRLSQAEKSISINDLMPFSAFNFIKYNYSRPLTNSKILLLGVSYRSDVGDTRYSPVKPLYQFLLHEKAEISLHDPFVPYWEEIESEVPNDIEELLGHPYDLIILTTSHTCYRSSELLFKYIESNPEIIFFDLVGVIPEKIINNNKHKNIKVLGRGDI